MPATLGQVIRERRMELDLTQEELAERVGHGVRQSDISRLERNRVGLPRRHRMEELAAALDIPLGVLLSRSGWAGAEALDDAENLLDADEAIADEPAGAGGASGLDSSPGHSPGDPGVLASGLERDQGQHPRAITDDEDETPNPDWDDSRNLYSFADDPGQRDADSLSAEDSQSIRDTVTRTEALIRQTRERIDDTHSKLAESRRSAERRQPTGPS